MSGFPESDLMRWVQVHSERLTSDWRSCCSIPSVSAEGPAAVTEMARWLRERAGSLFDRLQVFDAPGGAPVLVGTVDGTGPRRLLLYTHYDVVPPGEGWTHDPFGAAIIDGTLYARGSGDDKADVMARLHALEAWCELRGAPPFSIIWLSEGMEEVGSPGLREVITAHLPELRADWCLWESYYRSIDERAPAIGFGSRGVLTAELSVRLLDGDTHSGMAGVYRSAAMILTRAIASLTDAEGRVRLPGFYDAVVELPVPPDLDLPPMVDTDADASALWSRDRRELARRWLYEPTFNVSSLHAGPAADDHEATVLPASARARLDIRLMPDQDPEAIAVSLRDWLRDEGFPEVRLEVLNMLRPARGALDSPLAEAVRTAAREMLTGGAPTEHPVVPGSGPLHLFTEQMGIEAVMPPGTIRPDSGMHGPDENVRVADYLDTVRLTLRTFELLADALGNETRGGIA